jgi:hypothetical protein
VAARAGAVAWPGCATGARAVPRAVPRGRDLLSLLTPLGSAGLIFTQTGYDQLGRAFELARTVYQAGRYLFRGTPVPASDGDDPVVRMTPPPAGAAHE